MQHTMASVRVSAPALALENDPKGPLAPDGYAGGAQSAASERAEVEVRRFF